MKIYSVANALVRVGVACLLLSSAGQVDGADDHEATAALRSFLAKDVSAYVAVRVSVSSGAVEKPEERKLTYIWQKQPFKLRAFPKAALLAKLNEKHDVEAPLVGAKGYLLISAGDEWWLGEIIGHEDNVRLCRVVSCVTDMGESDALFFIANPEPQTVIHCKELHAWFSKLSEGGSD